MRAFFLAVLFSLVSSITFAHGYHVSIAQVDFNPETRSLEISLKLITEDIEFVLEKQGADKLHLGEENESDKADQYIQEYLSKNFVLYVNDKSTTQSYLGKEVEDGNTWCYIEVNVNEEIQSIEVMNSIFIEAFHNQSNRVNLNIGGKNHSFVFSPGLVKDKVSF